MSASHFSPRIIRALLLASTILATLLLLLLLLALFYLFFSSRRTMIIQVTLSSNEFYVSMLRALLVYLGLQVL